MKLTKMIERITILFLLAAFMVQCHSHTDRVMTQEEIRNAEDAMVTANRMLVKKDKNTIEAYIKKHGLLLQESPSGLWYGITTQGTGKPVTINSLITLAYSVSLLDGTPCYSSDSLGYKQFRVGQGGVESGLEEGVLYLTEGSKAIFIMPPHLAHGLTGDDNKIPARSIIVYHVELLKVEP
jgi:FKBP-type peptidyl-prolyl cis-trans isomerase